MPQKSKQSISPSVQRALRNYREGFLNVLIALQSDGVDLQQGTAHEFAGLSKTEFNKCTLASAKATWDKAQEIKSKRESDPWRSYDYLRMFPNVCECLGIVNAELSSDRSFAVLGITKVEFDAACRDAVVVALRNLPDHATKSTGNWMTLMPQCIMGGLEAAKIDPTDDAIFQEAGFASRADYDALLTLWSRAATEQKNHHSCDGHNHAKPTNPAP